MMNDGLSRSDVIDLAWRMLTASPAAAVRLVRGETIDDLLDLCGVSEVRCSSQGSVEVRLADRVALLRLVVEDAKKRDGVSAEALLLALSREVDDFDIGADGGRISGGGGGFVGAD